MQGKILLHKYEKLLDEKITPKLKFMDQNLSARIDILKLTYENLQTKHKKLIGAASLFV